MRPVCLLLAAAALLLAGCGEVPQPFRHDGAPPRLARPKLERGVTIRPLDGYEHADAFAAALVKAMEGRDVPALVGRGPAFGHVVEGSPEDGGMVVWTLKTPDGAEAASYRQRLPDAPEPARLKRAAADAATVLAQPLSLDPDAVPRMVPGAGRSERPTARLVTLAGLPGDGDKSLNAAIRSALERAGVTIGDDGEFVVQGAVTVTPRGPGEDEVLVVWTVKRAKDGSQLASIDQGGTVPRGRLALPWGSLARDIAEGGAVGIAQVTRHARAKAPADSPPPEPRREPEGTREPGASADPAAAPTMFTEQRPADIRAQDSREQQTEARTAAQPVPTIVPAPRPKASLTKPVKTATKAVPVRAKAVKGGRVKATTKPVPSSRIQRPQR